MLHTVTSLNSLFVADHSRVIITPVLPAWHNNKFHKALNHEIYFRLIFTRLFWSTKPHALYKMTKKSPATLVFYGMDLSHRAATEPNPCIWWALTSHALIHMIPGLIRTVDQTQRPAAADRSHLKENFTFHQSYAAVEWGFTVNLLIPIPCTKHTFLYIFFFFSRRKTARRSPCTHTLANSASVSQTQPNENWERLEKLQLIFSEIKMSHVQS